MNLPNKVKIPNEVLQDDDFEAITDYLSDKYGFCIFGLNIEGSYAVNIKWDESE